MQQRGKISKILYWTGEKDTEYILYDSIYLNFNNLMIKLITETRKELSTRTEGSGTYTR